jgi:hemerythrin superfamily protein
MEKIMVTAQKKSITENKPKAQEAITLLKADHKLVSMLFEQYETAKSSTKKKAIVSQICTELTVHAQLEEEIFYPQVRAALKDKELVPEAIVEHATLKELITQLEDGEPGDELYNAKVKVLSEYVKHHVKEEQNEIFPKAKASKLDMYALGEQLVQRREELLVKQ